MSFFISRRTPRGGFVAEFVKKYYEQVACGPHDEPSNLRLTGGKFAVPDDLYMTFLKCTAKDVELNESTLVSHTMTEVVTDIAPLFADLDVWDQSTGIEHYKSDAGRQEVLKWVKAAVDAVAMCLPPGSRPVLQHYTGDDERENDLLKLRDGLDRDTCVVSMAPPRLVLKNKNTGVKVGIHLIWPNICVTKSTAMQLRSIIITGLNEHCAGRVWEEIVDASVYRKLSSLRMIGSFKPKTCEECRTPQKDIERARERALRAQLVKDLSLDRTASFFVVKKALDQKMTVLQGKTLERGTEYVLLLRELRGEGSCACNGKQRIADLAVGAYRVSAVMKSGGELLDELHQRLTDDTFMALCFSSVRRPYSTTTPTMMAFPPHAPAAAVVKLTTTGARGKAAAGAAGNQHDEEEVPELEKVLSYEFVSPVPASERKLLKVNLTDQQVIADVQIYLRSGAMGGEYKSVQICQLYRLVNTGREGAAGVQSEANIDGTPPYSVVAAVRGYGSKFCSAQGRDHNVNSVFFQFTPNMKCTQRCRSSKSAICQKAGRVKDVTHAAYTALFPFSGFTTHVLDAEVSDWISGKLDYAWLNRFNAGGREIVSCSRTDRGAMFRVMVQIGRMKQGRIALSEKNKEKETSGKHDREDEKMSRNPKKAKETGAGEHDDDDFCLL